MDSCPTITPCGSCTAKTIDTSCRTCTKAVTNYQCLQHVIDDSDTQRKTYGELLKDLLQMDHMSIVDDCLPQSVCKGCAVLLRNIYAFISKARESQAELMVSLNNTREGVQIKKESEKIDSPLSASTEVPITTKIEMFKSAPATSTELEIIGNPLLNFNNDMEVAEYTLSCSEVNSISACNAISHLETENKEDLKWLQNPLSVRRDMWDKMDKSDKLYRCQSCDKVFRTFHSLQCHLATHNHEKQYNCSDCGKSFKHKSRLMDHVLLHSLERPFKCHSCDKAFKRSSSLQSHLKIHCDEKPRTCSECGKSYDHEDKFLAHMRIHSSGKLFKCHFCQEIFGTLNNLKYHQVSHNNERPHICSECAKSFKHKDQLQAHMRDHFFEKPRGRSYNCSECNRSFKHKDNLDVHKRVHSGLGPYECTECEKTFKYASGLKYHLLHHTVQKP
ncbi:zinc finger protein 664-like isoform X3 [Glossina fuscipes]|uniref:Zinc finger protein 664-like isoform X3 n=1 Tax=Glossina fuscipes TaxID=7396 RepID=A0A9C6E0F9_9MUSC|nr:zinc finger protein 664-like isoform X3 [Glossina fuscipes]